MLLYQFVFLSVSSLAIYVYFFRIKLKVSWWNINLSITSISSLVMYIIILNVLGSDRILILTFLLLQVFSPIIFFKFLIRNLDYYWAGSSKERFYQFIKDLTIVLFCIPAYVISFWVYLAILLSQAMLGMPQI